MFSDKDFARVKFGRSKKRQEYLEHLLTYKAGDTLKTDRLSRNALMYVFSWYDTPFSYYDKKFGYKTLGVKYYDYAWDYVYYHRKPFKQEHIDFLEGYYAYAFVPKDDHIESDY